MMGTILIIGLSLLITMVTGIIVFFSPENGTSQHQTPSVPPIPNKPKKFKSGDLVKIKLTKAATYTVLSVVGWDYWLNTWVYHIQHKDDKGYTNLFLTEEELIIHKPEEMSTKIKQGNNVRIRDAIQVGCVSGNPKVYFISDMQQYKNRCLTIDKVISPGVYNILEDGGRFVYTADMLEPWEDFKLPEKWCVLETHENHEVINKWFIDHLELNRVKPQGVVGYIYLEEDAIYGWRMSTIKPKGYTEITFEQFKKYVMKEETKTTTMDKKIVGYLLLKDTPQTKAGSIFRPDVLLSVYSCTHSKEWFQPIFMADTSWFKPIYEEDKIEIGGYEVKFIKRTHSNCTTIDDNCFTQDFWEAARTITRHAKAKIMIGCNKQFDVSIGTINKILDKLNSME